MVGVGGEFVSHVLAGLLLGWGVDWAFNVRPWGILGGAIAGLLVGTAQFIRAAMRINAGLGPVTRPPGGWKPVDDPLPPEAGTEGDADGSEARRDE